MNAKSKLKIVEFSIDTSGKVIMDCDFSACHQANICGQLLVQTFGTCALVVIFLCLVINILHSSCLN